MEEVNTVERIKELLDGLREKVEVASLAARTAQEEYAAALALFGKPTKRGRKATDTPPGTTPAKPPRKKRSDKGTAQPAEVAEPQG